MYVIAWSTTLPPLLPGPGWLEEMVLRCFGSLRRRNALHRAPMYVDAPIGVMHMSCFQLGCAGACFLSLCGHTQTYEALAGCTLTANEQDASAGSAGKMCSPCLCLCGKCSNSFLTPVDAGASRSARALLEVLQRDADRDICAPALPYSEAAAWPQRRCKRHVLRNMAQQYCIRPSKSVAGGCCALLYQLPRA